MKNKEKYDLEFIHIHKGNPPKYEKPVWLVYYNGKTEEEFIDYNKPIEVFDRDSLSRQQAFIKFCESEYQEPPILDEKEKEFLQFQYDHIHPEIIEFMKFDCELYENGERHEVEDISYKTKNKEKRTFPTFKKGSMYKGMNLGEYYTPEELGLKVKK